jgi:hypothetical protein
MAAGALIKTRGVGSSFIRERPETQKAVRSKNLMGRGEEAEC